VCGLARKLRPDLCVKALEDVDLDWLAARGVRGVLLDVDNTLVPWKSREVTDAKRAWVEGAKERFGVCLLSNTIFGHRLKYLGDMLGIGYVGRWGLGRKPFLGGLRVALRTIGVEAPRAVMIGDQIFADIWAGKNGGLTTVLVDAVNPHAEFPSTRLVRFFERGFRRRWAEERSP
jgi:putative phosphatase